MKKIDLQKINNEDLFGKFKDNKLALNSSSNLRGGTSTTLCRTSENFFDPDSGANQEEIYTDPRCSYT